MRRKGFAILGMLAAMLIQAPAAAAAASGRWIHVAVDEHGTDGATVRVNVPLELVTKVLPLIRNESMAGGKVKLAMGDVDLSLTDLRTIWEGVRSSRDGAYVTLDRPAEKVRVAKRGDLLLVEAAGGEGGPQRVEVRIPVAVVDALFSGGEKDRLDVAAAVEALAHAGSGDLVTVTDVDSHVRIWIDANGSAE